MAVHYHEYKAHFFKRSSWDLDGFQVVVESKRGRKVGKEGGRDRGRNGGTEGEREGGKESRREEERMGGTW